MISSPIHRVLKFLNSCFLENYLVNLMSWYWLFSAISKFFGDLDRRIKVLFFFIGLHSFDRALTAQYNQLYAKALGASAIVLGTLNSTQSIASSLVSVPTGWLSDRYGNKTVILIGLVLTVSTSFIYAVAGNWWILIPAILLYACSQTQVVKFVDIFFINLVKPEQRGVIMSLSRMLWAIISIFAPMFAAVVITNSGGLNAPLGGGIRPLYYIQFGVGVLVFFSIFFLLKNPEKSVEKQNSLEKKGNFLQDFRDVFSGEGGKYCKRWVVLFVCHGFGPRVASAFVPLWLVMKGADPYVLGIMGTIQIIVALFIQVPAGRLSDKIGRGRWMGIIGIISIFSFPASILGGLMWQLEWYIPVLLFPVAVQGLIMMPLVHTIPETLKQHPVEVQ